MRDRFLVAILGVWAVCSASGANPVWSGAAGECRLDDSSKWENFVSWEDTANTWLIIRSQTAAACTATLAGDLTLPKVLTFRNTGPLTFDFGAHTLTVPSLTCTDKSFVQNLKMSSGTLTLAKTLAAADAKDGYIYFNKSTSSDTSFAFTGKDTTFNGSLMLFEHTGAAFTFANGTTWNGTFDILAGDETIVITGAGTTVNGNGGSFGLGGTCGNYYTYADAAKYPAHAQNFRGAQCEISDGAQVTNAAEFFVGRYAHHATLVVSNAVFAAPSCAFKIGDETYSSNNVVRLLDHAVVTVGDLRIGQFGRSQLVDLAGGASLTVGGNSFIMGNKASSRDNLLRIHGGATFTNKASIAYVGTAGVVSNRIEVYDGGELYSVGEFRLSFNGSEGSRLSVSDRGRIVMPGTLCVGYNNKTPTIPTELFIGANGTGVCNAVSLRDQGSRLVISNGTLSAATIGTQNGSGYVFAVSGAKALVRTTGNISLSDTAPVLSLDIPKTGFETTPIQCGGTFNLRDSAVLKLKVEKGIDGWHRIATSANALTASGNADKMATLIARWNEELKAQKDFRLKFALRDGGKELWLYAHTKGGLAILIR